MFAAFGKDPSYQANVLIDAYGHFCLKILQISLTCCTRMSPDETLGLRYLVLASVRKLDVTAPALRKKFTT